MVDNIPWWENKNDPDDTFNSAFKFIDKTYPEKDENLEVKSKITKLQAWLLIKTYSEINGNG